MPNLTLSDRFKNAFNAFTNRDPTRWYDPDIGAASYYRPDRMRLSRGNERSIVTAIYNRIAIDVASVAIRHIREDENGRFLNEIDSGLNNIFSLEANIDQTARNFVQDIVMSMMDEGTVAIVPVDTDVNPQFTDSYDIKTMRTGKITQWHPEHVKVNLYNDRTGHHEELLLPKRTVGIVENPLYAIMNEYNSTLQRLIRKLVLLDAIDEQSGSGKLDLIIQLPYVIKSDARQQQAEKRRQQIEMQLAGSKYGIAYTDGTERITQLNRSVDNQLMNQIEYLTSMLYGQLGITENVINGTADEKEMLNYNNRTIEPILSAITIELERKFLTKTARSQMQSVAFFRDPFKLVPVEQMAEIADKFTRNEILSPNEIRQIIGVKPSEDAKADELRNRNLNVQEGEMPATTGEEIPMDEEEVYDEETDVSPMDVPISELQ